MRSHTPTGWENGASGAEKPETETPQTGQPAPIRCPKRAPPKHLRSKSRRPSTSREVRTSRSQGHLEDVARQACGRPPLQSRTSRKYGRSPTLRSMASTVPSLSRQRPCTDGPFQAVKGLGDAGQNPRKDVFLEVFLPNVPGRSADQTFVNSRAHLTTMFIWFGGTTYRIQASRLKSSAGLSWPTSWVSNANVLVPNYRRKGASLPATPRAPPLAHRRSPSRPRYAGHT